MALGNFFNRAKEAILGSAENPSLLNRAKVHIQKTLRKKSQEVRNEVDETLEHPAERELAEQLCKKLDAKTKIRILKTLHGRHKEKGTPDIKGDVPKNTAEQISTQIKKMADERGISSLTLEKSIYHQLWKEYQEEKRAMKEGEQELDPKKLEAARELQKNAELIVEQIRNGNDAENIERELTHLLRKEFEKGYATTSSPSSNVSKKTQQILFRLAQRQGLKKEVYKILHPEKSDKTEEGVYSVPIEKLTAEQKIAFRKQSEGLVDDLENMEFDEWAEKKIKEVTQNNTEPKKKEALDLSENQIHNREEKTTAENFSHLVGQEMMYQSLTGKLIKVKVLKFNPDAIKPSLILQPQKGPEFAINLENANRLSPIAEKAHAEKKSETPEKNDKNIVFGKHTFLKNEIVLFKKSPRDKERQGTVLGLDDHGYLMIQQLGIKSTVKFPSNSENLIRPLPGKPLAHPDDQGRIIMGSVQEIGKQHEINKEELEKRKLELQQQKTLLQKKKVIEKLFDEKISTSEKIGLRIISKSGTVRQVLNYIPGTKQIVFARIDKNGNIKYEELGKETFLNHLDQIEIKDLKKTLINSLFTNEGETRTRNEILSQGDMSELKEINDLLSNSLYSKKIPLLDMRTIKQVLGNENKHWKKIAAMTHEDKIGNLSPEDQEKCKLIYKIMNNLKIAASEKEAVAV